MAYIRHDINNNVASVTIPCDVVKLNTIQDPGQKK